MSELQEVCVIGLGEVGLPTALYIRKRKLKVWGFDINEMAVKKARAKGIKASTDFTRNSFSRYLRDLCFNRLKK